MDSAEIGECSRSRLGSNEKERHATEKKVALCGQTREGNVAVAGQVSKENERRATERKTYARRRERRPRVERVLLAADKDTSVDTAGRGEWR